MKNTSGRKKFFFFGGVRYLHKTEEKSGVKRKIEEKRKENSNIENVKVKVL
jgi:hypothetical protein